MTENLPAVPEVRPVVVARDTDSWVEIVKDVALLAESVAKTTFVPEALRNNVPGTAAAILYGREIGLPPMTALQTTTVIKGRVGIYAEQQRAMILAAGHELEFREMSSGKCTIAGRRRGQTMWTEVSYTLDEARQAGHTRNNQNYDKSPADMLLARATTRLAKMLFPDVIRGMGGVEELLDEAGVADGITERAPMPTTTTKVQRKTRTTKSGAAMGGAAPDDGGEPRPSPPSSPPLPPLPGEPGDQTDGGAEPDSPPQGPATSPQAEPAAPPSSDSDGGAGAPPAAQPLLPDEAIAPPASPSDQSTSPRSGPNELKRRAWLRGLHAKFRELGFTDAERVTRLRVLEVFSQEELTSSEDLTYEGAQKAHVGMAPIKSKAQLYRLMKEIANAPIEDLTGED